MAFEKLERHGLVERVIEARDEDTGREYAYAVATASGLALLRKRGAELQAKSVEIAHE